MEDSKYKAWKRLYSNNNEDRAVVNGPDMASHIPGSITGGDGWQHYRQWISKAPSPGSHRTGVDPAVYTWKGYRVWTEQVKRNWRDN